MIVYISIYRKQNNNPLKILTLHYAYKYIIKNCKLISNKCIFNIYCRYIIYNGIVYYLTYIHKRVIINMGGNKTESNNN